MFQFQTQHEKNKSYPKSRTVGSKLLPQRKRGWLLGMSTELQPATGGEVPTIIAVGGGKGGVGKSIFSSNLATKLAQQGFRVLVVDMDLGCANLHTHFGIAMPSKTLADFVIYGRKEFSEILLPTPIPGVGLVAGGREEVWAEHLSKGRDGLSLLFEAIFECRKKLQVDFVIFDLGAGTYRHTMDFFCAAHLGVVLVLPEPTSIENAYVFLRTFLWNILDNVSLHTDLQEAAADVKAALTSVTSGSLSYTYLECLKRMALTHHQYISEVMAALQARNIGLILNQTRLQSDIDIGWSMEHICRKYFGFQTDYLGFLNYDDSAWKSLRNRRLLVQDFPQSLLARRLSKVVTKSLSVLGYNGSGV